MSTWISDPPEKCDICKCPIDKVFVDGQTVKGVWCIMCPACHDPFGMSLGTGLGQKYRKQANGIFVKVAG